MIKRLHLTMAAFAAVGGRLSDLLTRRAVRD
jgi:hypothetical protein